MDPVQHTCSRSLLMLSTTEVMSICKIERPSESRRADTSCPNNSLVSFLLYSIFKVSMLAVCGGADTSQHSNCCLKCLLSITHISFQDIQNLQLKKRLFSVIHTLPSLTCLLTEYQDPQNYNKTSPESLILDFLSYVSYHGPCLPQRSLTP